MIKRLSRKYGSFWPFVLGLTFLFLVFFVGVYGYMTIEGWGYLDSLYMVVISLATVGFQEVHSLSDNGRIFTIILILTGVGNFAFLIGSFTQILVEGRLQAVWGRLRVQKSIDKLKNHIIVCGYGQIGSIAVREIMLEGLPVVVIEKDPDLVNRMDEQEVLYISGDATSDEVLLRAGLERAKTLIAALSQEAANVYVSLTAKQLNPKVHIVARADSEEHISRLERAGADRVMMPHVIGGMRMAQTVLRPAVTSFLELAMRGEELDLQLEQLEITPRSELAGKNLIESQIRPRFNLMIIAVKKPSGELIFNPDPKTALLAGDVIITVGGKENLRRLWEII